MLEVTGSILDKFGHRDTLEEKSALTDAYVIFAAVIFLHPEKMFILTLSVHCSVKEHKVSKLESIITKIHIECSGSV